MDLISRLEQVLDTNPCVVGMGNYLRNDDAVGLYIVDGIEKALHPGKHLIMNVEDIIESYVFKIAELDCDTVIIIDAVSTVRQGVAAGSVLFGKLNEFNELIGDFSTHKLALRMSGKILEEHGKNTYLLGIVAEDIDFGTELTPEVRKSADSIRDFIIESLRCEQKENVYEH
ncbi:MAG: hydrogenase maturation protease [bacterium]|nr:hydrogenase maturation protease [bacterium]